MSKGNFLINNRRELNKDLFKKIYLIRKVEEKIIEDYDNNELKTPMHMSMGEEAIVAGVCQALTKKDAIFGTYRSHGIYLARTGDTDKFFAEMYGKQTGSVKGKGGSMHLSFPEMGLVATSAVVASTISVAVGAAFAQKLNKKSGISAVFFGDGAIDEGTFWESLNMACLFKLPILFVCEDNGLAVHSPGVTRHGYRSISKIVSGFNCKVYGEDSTDAEVLYELAQSAKKHILHKSMPAFLHLKYFRYLEHVGTHEDFDAGYRSRDEFQRWLKVDPLDLQIKKLRSLGIADLEIDKEKLSIDSKINKSIAKAKAAAFPGKEDLYKDVYYES